MPQRSKKNHIVESALPLFLEHGFKGTSIDMVVRASGVSKPTVYNHFPDKASLMHAVLAGWVDANKPMIKPLRDRRAFEELIERGWLSDVAVGLYAIVIGEGRRFPAARRLFWEQFDALWRKALRYAAAQTADADAAAVEPYLDQQLVRRLRML